MLRSFATLAIIGLGVAGSAAFAADDSAKQPESAAQQSAPAASGSPTATAESAPKGTLKSPYPDFAKVADEGHKKFMAAGCNGCHGGGGGGGMGPPLTNEVWVYGKDDDTLFRLIALGSDGLQKQGYARKGSENVVGPMPAMGVREQKKSRMSPQCQKYAETDVQTVPESEIEIFSCDDPAFAPQKTRILEFVKSVNEVYRAQNRPLYSETISGLCAIVRETTAKRKTDLCNPSEKLRGAPIENLPVVWNIRASGNDEWPLEGDSYSPSSGYGGISCFKRPDAGQVMTKGCRRWGVELPVIGARRCDCECGDIVCEEDAWTRK